ncbi:MAG: beta-lactamase family protein [Gemmatimonadaceae bacterium]|nr:beta-lactamase family protein [Chitinophagaceae bacterium]
MKIILWLAVVATANSLNAQTDAKRIAAIKQAIPVIDKLYSEYAINNHFPGYIYGIVVDGKLIHTSQSGLINIDQKIAVTPQSDFRIASMSKSLTAMAILKLRDEGKLRLDDPAWQYMPELKNQQYLSSDATPITIRHLLTHSAGFPEDNPWGDRQLAVSDEQMLSMISKGISFSNLPGVTYEYSNMGFAILGYIVKKVSGQPYQKYITENIFKPLGMNNTYWEYTEVPADKLALGYRWVNGNWQTVPLLKDGAYGAMGGLITTMEDFSKYVSFQLSAWPVGANKESGPVGRSSLREMQRASAVSSLTAGYRYLSGRVCPIVSGYGYGLRQVIDCENKVIRGHSGGLPGFGSDWMMLPEYGVAVIAFANITYSGVSRISMSVLDTLVRLAQLQPYKKPVSAILEQRKNELVRLLPDWKNAEASGIFAENFFLDYFTDSLRNEAKAIYARAGKILKVGEFTATNNLRGSFILEGERSNIEISFTLTPENPALIQEYHIREVGKR